MSTGRGQRADAAGSPAPSAVEIERRRWRRGRGILSILLAALSTIVFAVLVWLVIVRTPGWASVQQSFFDPASWAHAFPRVLSGFVLNLRVLLFSSLAVAVLGTLIAALRTLRGPVFFPLRVLAAAYTDVFRSLPLIIVLYLIGFGVPALGIVHTRIPAELLGVIALTLTYSSYVAEVLRAGLDAVHPSQRLAARSLGLGAGQTLRLILLPQALRNVTPALLNDFVSLQKDVGLISVLGAIDAVRAAQSEANLLFDFTPYVVAGVLFLLLGIPTIRIVDAYTARLRRREQMGVIV